LSRIALDIVSKNLVSTVHLVSNPMLAVRLKSRFFNQKDSKIG